MSKTKVPFPADVATMAAGPELIGILDHWLEREAELTYDQVVLLRDAAGRVHEWSGGILEAALAWAAANGRTDLVKAYRERRLDYLPRTSCSPGERAGSAAGRTSAAQS